MDSMGWYELVGIYTVEKLLGFFCTLGGVVLVDGSSYGWIFKKGLLYVGWGCDVCFAGCIFFPMVGDWEWRWYRV